jgi:hypothetical protein
VININYQRFMSVIIIVAAYIFISCQGPTGVDGDDAFIADTLSPVIEWQFPNNGDSLFTTIEPQDTSIVLSAIATDDNVIRQMVFYCGGYEQKGILVDSATGTYNFDWHYGLYPIGPYPLMARCWDEAGNMSTSRIIQVEVLNFQ